MVRLMVVVGDVVSLRKRMLRSGTESISIG